LDVKLITSPDLDYSNNFKILLVDFNWQNIEQYSHIFTACEEDITVYIYSQKDADPKWCINAAEQAKVILINCESKSVNEILKGYLLAYKNAAAFGKNDQVIFAKETYYDIAVWFTKVTQKFNLIQN
jgi:ribosome biogenesis protein Tsr3